MTRAPANKRHSEMDVTPVRIQSKSALQFRVALLVSTHHGESHSEPMVRIGMTGIQFDGAFKLLLCCSEIVVVMQCRPSERRVSFRQAVIDFECLKRQVSCFGATFCRRE